MFHVKPTVIGTIETQIDQISWLVEHLSDNNPQTIGPALTTDDLLEEIETLLALVHELRAQMDPNIGGIAPDDEPFDIDDDSIPF
jgi:hypothetical protein